MSHKRVIYTLDSSQIFEMTVEEFERETGNKCGKFKSRRGIA